MFNRKSKIYAIADHETCLKHNIDDVEFAKALINGGIKIIQYRNKISDINTICKIYEDILKLGESDTIFIINDYEEIAVRYNTALHVGQSDRITKPGLVFGRSTHNMDEVEKALNENPQPEYIGFGTMFQSDTKPEIKPGRDRLNEVLKLWKKDIVLIGGIRLENIRLLPAEDRIYYAVINDFFSAGSKPGQIEKQAAKLLNELF